MSEKEKDKNLKPDEIEDLEEDEEVIVLVNEETGEEAEFSLLAMLEVGEKTYAYLEPVEALEGFEEGDLLINEVQWDDDGNESFLLVEDDEEIEAAFAAFDDEYFKRYGVHCDGSDEE